MTSTLTMIDMEPFVIDLRASEPSYRQLAKQLRERIESGEIGPDEQLPSLTYLKGETGLAVGTIRQAIAVLVEEGLAYTVPGRGTYATPVKKD
jgi:GntR family transcriptional regulator